MMLCYCDAIRDSSAVMICTLIVGNSGKLQTTDLQTRSSITVVRAHSIKKPNYLRSSLAPPQRDDMTPNTVV